MDEVSHLKSAGIDFGAPQVNIDTLRGHKEKVIGKLTGGLAQMAKMRKVTVLRGYGHFVGANHLEVEETTGTSQDKTGAKKVVAFKRAIIAAGSQAVRLPFMPDDPRVVDSTGALALQGVPKRMLILGGGIIGLEMGTVYSTLGARLDVVEMLDGLMQGADRDLVKVWQKMNQHRFDNVMLNTKTVAAEATPEGIKVSFAPAVVFRRRLHRTSEASCTTAADEGDPSGNNGAAAENWQPKGLSERPSFFGTPTSRHNAASAYSASVPCQQCLGIPALFRAWGSGHWTPPVAPQVQLPHQNMRPTLKHYDRNVMVQRC